MRSTFLVCPFFMLMLLVATTTAARDTVRSPRSIPSPEATQAPEAAKPEYQPLAIAIVVCPDDPLFTEIVEIPSGDDPTLDGTLPPGLQKKLQPCPVEITRQLPPLPPDYQRGVIGAHIVVFNTHTNIIVDVMRDVVH